MTHLKIIRNGFAGFVIVSAFGITGALVSASAQESESKPTPAAKSAPSSARDPFKKYEAPRNIVKVRGQLLPPAIQERIAQYRAQKVAAMNARMPAPKPTTALLLNEISVIGITHTPRGYAAIVEALPIRLSYVIYPGEKFYDGQLVAIEENRLVFRHETVFTDGRRERSVETKVLLQPSTADALTVVKTAPAITAVAEPKASATDKP
jgi:hypothetical protein